MKTVSLFACVILSGFGLYKAITVDWVAGSILLFIGAIAMLIIAPDRGAKQNPFYDHKSWMNK